MKYPRNLRNLIPLTLTGLLMFTIALAACGGGGDSLTVYSGRSQSLVQPILDDFTEQTGIEIRVNYAGTAQITATILEEGDNSPADVVFLQDPGFLGVLSQEGLLDILPEDILNKVDEKFRSWEGEWVGVTGRARTVVYNTSTIDPATDLPDSILDFTDEKWKGRIGWPPQNASFQAFVTGLRVQLGEEVARQWLEGIEANNPRSYPNNTTIVQAAGLGEIDIGFVNHYYLHRFLDSEGEGFGARNFYIGNEDPGALVLTAGAGILKTSKKESEAEQFIDFLLGREAQEFFANETKEYPLVVGFNPLPELLPLDQLDPPDINLSDLYDAEGTLDLMRDVGIIP